LKEGTLADLLRGGNAQQMMAAALGPKLLLGDRKETANGGCCACSEGHGVKKQMAVWTPAHSSPGGVEKEPRGNALSNEMALQQRQMDGQMLTTASAANHPAAAHPFEAMTFSFAQMGSGGQAHRLRSHPRKINHTFSLRPWNQLKSTLAQCRHLWPIAD
jgi:hypothetical protein